MEINMPNGYLTYIVAILAVIGGISAHYLGWIDSTVMTQFILNGLGLFGVRKSIDTASKSLIEGSASHW